MDGTGLDRTGPGWIRPGGLQLDSFPDETCRYQQNAKVMSWWDYGYQITAMANRTILVDNNTWNNTHISRVGQVFTFFRDSDLCKLGIILLQ